MSRGSFEYKNQATCALDYVLTHLNELSDDELIKLSAFADYEFRERDIAWESVFKQNSNKEIE